MRTLIVGASGATGKHLVEQLLLDGNSVKIVVRSPDKLPDSWKDNPRLTIISASLLDMTDEQLTELCSDCQAVASCLGHNMTWKGIYGQPRKLVTDATRRLCQAIETNKASQLVKFVLMNTTGNRNHDLDEQISFTEKCTVGLIRFMLPPHSDNEDAAEYLRTEIGQQNKFVQWAAVRPDNLTDDNEVSPFEIYPSPIRSAIFKAGKTSRINVGRFMADLITDNEVWNKWKGQMPVIYNSSSLE